MPCGKILVNKCNNMELKIKQLSKEQIIISIDRLTRFKEPETKYLRVYMDIITSNLIDPKYRKTDLENMDYCELRRLAEEIINYSLKNMGLELIEDYSINQRLYDYENSIFELKENVKELLKNKINYRAITSFISSDCPKNLQWLAELGFAKDIITVRRQKALKFPIEKLLLVEGITEETLLPEFAKIMEFDFDKNGIYVISAGGKNQVVKYFYRLAQNCKLPVFILLDKDVIEKANALYTEQLPKICDIISNYIEEHKAEYLAFPYLNKKVDMNLILWQQVSIISWAFSENVERILKEKYFSDVADVKRPFSVFGYVDNGKYYGGGWDGVDAQNVCGFSNVHLDNIYITRIKKHFSCGLNVSKDPQIQLALRSIEGLDITALSIK